MSQLPHLQLIGGVSGVPYTRPKSGFGEFQTPPRDRIGHARSIRQGLQSALAQGQAEIEAQPTPDAVAGLQFVIESHAGYDLRLESLENRQKGIKLLHVSQDGDVQRAVIFVPRTAFGTLSDRVDQYENDNTAKGRPKNARLVESIERIRLAIAEDLWSDPTPFPTDEGPLWWEAWIPLDGKQPTEIHGALIELAASLGIEVGRRWLTFSERLVTLVKARASDWARSRQLLETVAELRAPVEPAAPYLNLSPVEQADWVNNLKTRIRIAHPNAPSVCLLDTGVNRGHPLLEDSLLEADWQAVDNDWGSADNAENEGHGPHGTLMAGTALFGDLGERFRESGTLSLSHRLESIRILPRRGNNDPELYGQITQQAVYLAEVAAPARSRAICLAVTAKDASGQGAPSSWSAAVDQLAFGDGGSTRMVLVSAGNIREYTNGYAYPQSNLDAVGMLDDPAQASNALVVGAFTQRTQLSPGYAGWNAIAPAGGLAPMSRTSAAWDQGNRSPWPLKPDVVFEGGNLITDGSSSVSTCAETELLTTTVSATGALLDTNSGTSAGVAQASRLAARIMAKYPSLRAETIRALLVHSAEWTDAMREQVPGSTKEVVRRRVRTFGYGVPSELRAMSSLSNAVTLVSETAITPYTTGSNGAKANQMGLHELPWPSDALYALGDVQVGMRVTLSYFIEPNPGRRGRIPRTRYASHGLRFDVLRPGETVEEFRQRVSAAERDDPDADIDTTGESRDWVIGVNGRARGSLQADWWEGSATQLAGSYAIAVYPVTGWWKERSFLGKVDSPARYSLIVSIETPPEAIDLYALLTTQTEIPVEAVANA